MQIRGFDSDTTAGFRSRPVKVSACSSARQRGWLTDTGRPGRLLAPGAKAHRFGMGEEGGGVLQTGLSFDLCC